MSEELIKKSDAINLCEKWRNRTNEHHDKDGWYIAVTLLNAIKELPSADRPQGEWFMGNRPLEGKFRIFRCSVCGYEPFYKGEPITPTNMTLRYCPNCGARMKGADDEMQ